LRPGPLSHPGERPVRRFRYAGRPAGHARADGVWPAGAYRTKLPILVAAYLLRPEPADVRIANGAAQSAQDAAATAPH